LKESAAKKRKEAKSKGKNQVSVGVLVKKRRVSSKARDGTRTERERVKERKWMGRKEEREEGAGRPNIYANTREDNCGPSRHNRDSSHPLA
jgi:hypothetical protein